VAEGRTAIRGKDRVGEKASGRQAGGELGAEVDGISTVLVRSGQFGRMG